MKVSAASGKVRKVAGNVKKSVKANHREYENKASQDQAPEDSNSIGDDAERWKFWRFEPRIRADAVSWVDMIEIFLVHFIDNVAGSSCK